VRAARLMKLRPVCSVFGFYVALAASAAAQTPVALTTVTSTPVTLAPSVGVIDFFGLNKVQPDRIRKTLGFQEGDPFPRSKAAVEEHLDTLPGVVESHLEAVCCDAGKTVLYVGIEERGAPHFDLRDEPEGEQILPEEISKAYRDFLTAFDTAISRGSTAEDLTRGYSLMGDSLAREIQQRFPAMAKDHLLELRDVLRNSADEEQRAIATYVIAYAPIQSDVANELQYALRDSDPGVRANAVHGLMALGVYARLHPDAGLKLETTWLIEMLHSLSWSDRDRALKALQIFTDQRDAAVLSQLKERALPALVEMSRWKTLAHALPAVILTGRIAGWTDRQIDDAWSRGDRESVIAAATGEASKKKSR
jgi:hypothetical protein